MRQFLGIDGGATHTTAILADEAGTQLGRRETGPTNLKLLDDAELLAPLRDLAQAFPQPDAIAIGLAGVWDEPDRRRVRQAAAICWPGVPCYAANDLEIALAAAPPSGPPRPEVLILSGTGSACYGRSPRGDWAKVGGWGHALGDQGSGYDIALSALRAVAGEYDHTGSWPPLGAALLAALQLNEPNDLIAWAQGAAKADLARQAVTVFEAWGRGDRLAAKTIRDAAKRLAHDGAGCARKLAARRPPTRFFLAGSVLREQPRFRAAVVRELRRLWPQAEVGLLGREPAWGAVELAKAHLAKPAEAPAGQPLAPLPLGARPPALPPGPTVRPGKLPPTEQRNPRSLGLDQLSPGAAIELMLAEDATIPQKLLAEKPRIERALGLIVRALRRGGRLFYVGAGTSGRLGVLDASECPPTFNTSPEQVQGIMAGGHVALWSSVEAGEDDQGAGARAVAFRGADARDVVVGIAASGTTPFVWGALGEARRRGAATILVCFNPFLDIPRALRPQVVIAPDLGPEVLTGSTRLKAGTATKLLLNLLTTLSMVRLGKVMSNLMVDVRASNTKLRERAVRITRELTGAEPEAARAALEATAWEIRAAVKMLNRTGSAHDGR